MGLDNDMRMILITIVNGNEKAVKIIQIKVITESVGIMRT